MFDCGEYTLKIKYIDTFSNEYIYICQGSILWGAGRGASPSPPKKSLPWKKNQKLFQILILFDNIKVSVKVAISANPEHYLFKRTPLEGLKKFFLAAVWLQKFWGIDSPPKQKVLNRTLSIVDTCVYIMVKRCVILWLSTSTHFVFSKRVDSLKGLLKNMRSSERKPEG